MAREGIKNDIGKPRVALVLGDFSKSLLDVSRVGTFGAEKYAPGDWKFVPDAVGRYEDAMMRHYLLSKEEQVDPESGLDHFTHFVWNALAVLELRLRQSQDHQE